MLLREWQSYIVLFLKSALLNKTYEIVYNYKWLKCLFILLFENVQQLA